MAVYKYLLTLFVSLHAASGSNFAFLIIDVQNCFLKGGAVAIRKGDDVIPTINNILEHHRDNFSLVVFTQDWHCANLVSFASQHPEKKGNEDLSSYYKRLRNRCRGSNCCNTHDISQTSWPDHCVINTTSANLSSRLNIKDDDIIIMKGYNCGVDSYSALYHDAELNKKQLSEILLENEITHIVIAGLPLEYSVYYTAKDARRLGYAVFVLNDACRSLNEHEHEVGDIFADMNLKGVNFIENHDIERIISGEYSGGSIHRQNYFAILLQTVAVVSVGMMIYK